MSKITWNSETAAEFICICEDLTGVKTNLTLTDEVIKGELMDIRYEKSEVGFSPLICSDEGIPDDLVKQCFMLAFCSIEKQQLGLVTWYDAESYIKDLCEKSGTKYVDFREIEETVRPVRRRLFPDPMDGGCFYRVGDVIHENPPTDGKYELIITDIGPLTEEGIMVSYKIIPNKYVKDTGRVITGEEAWVYRTHYLVRRAEE